MIFGTLEITDASKRVKRVLSLRNLFWGFCNLAVWRIVIKCAESALERWDSREWTEVKLTRKVVDSHSRCRCNPKGRNRDRLTFEARG
ncbi:MAG: hypothetical protein ACTS4U_00570 [Candidatus Hodgkinia cicadicola]